MKSAARTVKASKRVTVCSKPKQPHGLCLSCRNASDCTYSRNPDIAVLQCEEFEGETALRRRSPLPLIPSVRKTSVSALLKGPQEDPHRAKGLCSLCEGLETCTFPKPEGGVWHCEEYR